MISDLLLYIVPVVAIIAGPIIAWVTGRRSGRREAEQARDLSAHQQAQKGRQAASDERRRTAGFDPQHLTMEIDERTEQWRGR